MLFASLLFLSAFACAQSSLQSAAPPPAAPELSVTLRPASPNPNDQIPYVDIALRIEAMHASAGQALFVMPEVVANVQTVALDLQHLTASDQDGSIPLTTQNQTGEGGAPVQV